MQRGGYGFTITKGRIKPTVTDHHWLQPNFYFWSLLKKGELPLQSIKLSQPLKAYIRKIYCYIFCL